jgi:hypothetical protein
VIVLLSERDQSDFTSIPVAGYPFGKTPEILAFSNHRSCGSSLKALFMLMRAIPSELGAIEVYNRDLEQIKVPSSCTATADVADLA